MYVCMYVCIVSACDGECQSLLGSFRAAAETLKLVHLEQALDAIASLNMATKTLLNLISIHTYILKPINFQLIIVNLLNLDGKYQLLS